MNDLETLCLEHQIESDIRAAAETRVKELDAEIYRALEQNAVPAGGALDVGTYLIHNMEPLKITRK